MVKQYVPVLLYIGADGVITPKKVKAGLEGEWLRVIKVTGSRRMASLKAGAVGIRYTCIVNYYETQKKVYLFDEGQKWFIEGGE